ncbi:hypothetical protein ACFLS9_07540 [Bacteroidota bacterium]
MRKLALLFSAIVIMWGCQENSNIVDPIEYSNVETPQWVSLKSVEGLSLNKVLSTSKSIDGNIGGLIVLEGNSGNLSITATLEFLPGSFDGTKNITLSLDNELCVAKFSPSSTFEVPAIFNITYTGLNLEDVDTDNISFVYDAEDGTTETIQNDRITIDAGELSVANAKLPHFSRYGFIR